MDCAMFGWFRKKTPEEKHLLEQERLLEFRVSADEEVKVSAKRDAEIHEAVEYLGELISREGFATKKGWEPGWPMMFELTRDSEVKSANSHFRLYCSVDLSGENWDRLKPPRFDVEFEANGNFYDEDEGETLERTREGMTLAALRKFVEKMFEDERVFLAKFEH